MILQRLASAIRRQDWFQICIEVMIVVVGIFLGLQVDDWNTERAERAEERVYLERLLEEMTESLSVNELSKEIAMTRLSNVRLVSDSFTSCMIADEDKDRFANGLFRMNKFLAFSLTGTVVDELRSTGKFQIIQNLEIRDALSNHVFAVARITRITDAVRDSIRAHVNFAEKHYAFKNIVSEQAPVFSTREWDDLMMDFDGICGDPDIINAISHVYSYTDGLFGFLEPTLKQQRDLKAMIEAELEKF